MNEKPPLPVIEEKPHPWQDGVQVYRWTCASCAASSATWSTDRAAVELGIRTHVRMRHKVPPSGVPSRTR